LKTPEVTTVSPSFSPETTATKSPLRAPRRTICCLTTSCFSPVSSVLESTDVDRVAVGRVEDGGRRDRQDLVGDGSSTATSTYMPGWRMPAVVVDGGLDAHVAGGGVDVGADRRDLALDGSAGDRVAREPTARPVFELRQLLLGQVEVDEDGVERLERDDGVARLEVLAEVHEADAEPSREGRLDRPLVDRGLDVVGRRDACFEVASSASNWACETVAFASSSLVRLG
jgi:hypothetical protein